MGTANTVRRPKLLASASAGSRILIHGLGTADRIANFKLFVYPNRLSVEYNSPTIYTWKAEKEATDAFLLVGNQVKDNIRVKFFPIRSRVAANCSILGNTDL